MQTLNNVKQRLLINLQDTPEVAIRYQNGDPTITAMLQAMAGMIADQSVDIDAAITEPFIKSNPRTILADASNKGILPLATPCIHYVDFINKGDSSITVSSGRYIEDAQGRIWRLLQTAFIPAGELVKVQAEQSMIRTEQYVSMFSEPFLQVALLTQDDANLSGLRVYDASGNNYTYRTSWMNCAAGEYAFNLKTNSTRNIIVEFGDSQRCGTTVSANETLNFELIETDGDIDVTQLLEASLQDLTNSRETKLQVRFSEGGLIQMGGDPLSIEQLRLLSSYPTHDANAVFLGDYDYSVRKAFMQRCHYLTVWNETMQDTYYGAKLDDMNHLHVAMTPKNVAEVDKLHSDVVSHIGQVDSLYKDRVHIHDVEQRNFKLRVVARLAPVHNVEMVEEQIYTLLLARYGRDSLASSYFLADGFNLQEIAEALKKNITAFQDHISDFSLVSDDLSQDPIKPNQWVYMSRESIDISIQRTANAGANLWIG